MSKVELMWGSPLITLESGDAGLPRRQAFKGDAVSYFLLSSEHNLNE